MGLMNTLMHGLFNTFSKEPERRVQSWGSHGMTMSYGSRSDRNSLRANSGRSILASVFNQIAIDVAAVDIQHVMIDREQNNRYLSTRNTRFNECLTLEANLDETARAFKQNIVMTMFDKGTVAIVPIETDDDPEKTNAYDIYSMRVGEIVAWFPAHVRILLYNELKGIKEEITLRKDSVAIIENPMYSVMNESNATLNRLIRKLSLVDTLDEQAGSGKLDMIIQLPYVIKSEARQEQANNRRKAIEEQLRGSQYGIAYTDGTEKITQLNRPAENNMHKYVLDLTKQLYSQMGLTEEVFLGTASEAVMLNYFNRTLEPILTAITQELERTFISRTGRTQGQAVRYFRDPFKLVAVADMAEIGDKFVRNEIFAPNEMRAFMGVRPSTDKKADELRNPNMPVPEPGVPPPKTPPSPTKDQTETKEGGLPT